MIPQDEPDVTREQESFFRDVLSGGLRFAGLFFAIMIALNKNKGYRKWRPWLTDNVIKLIKEMRQGLREEPWIQRLEARYQQEAAPAVITRVLISFWAPVFGITIEELCGLLNEERDSALRRAFGLQWGEHCYPQRISELHQVVGGTKGKVEMHGRLVQEARTALGVKQLGIVLFDKGYWRVAEFKKLTEADRERIITPAKRYTDVKEALAAIPRSGWHRVGINLRCAETTVFFGTQEARFRLVAWKKLGRRAIRDEQGARVKDEHGQVMFELVIIVHSYLTNLSQVELEADQLLGMYSQRWGVEDFFEEAQNQYYLSKFPGTSLAVVQRHIILTFLLYVLVKLFQKQAAEWLEHAQYATMELRRFCKEFLLAPIAYLLWLKAGKPREQAKRGARGSSLYLRRLLSLGSSP